MNKYKCYGQKSFFNSFSSFFRQYNLKNLKNEFQDCNQFFAFILIVILQYNMFFLLNSKIRINLYKNAIQF